MYVWLLLVWIVTLIACQLIGSAGGKLVVIRSTSATTTTTTTAAETATSAYLEFYNVVAPMFAMTVDDKSQEVSGPVFDATALLFSAADNCCDLRSNVALFANKVILVPYRSFMRSSSRYSGCMPFAGSTMCVFSISRPCSSPTFLAAIAFFFLFQKYCAFYWMPMLQQFCFICGAMSMT
jgi:hypothetical protein